MSFIKYVIFNLLFIIVGCGDSNKEELGSFSSVKGVQQAPKDIGAYILITTVSASLLSKHRKNIGLEANSSIDELSLNARELIKQAIVWDNNNTTNLWQPGMRKNRQDYRYAGKVNGLYQTIQKNDLECSWNSTLERCNLIESVVDGIGMDVSHYLSKWPIFLMAMEQASKNSNESSYYKNIIKGTVKQVEKSVMTYKNEKYLLTNYMDGTNGVYRWNYVYRGKNWGYNPYELSYSYFFTTLGYLDDTKNSLFKAYRDILGNMNDYNRISPNSKTELLVRLSLKNHEKNPKLSCVDINNYQGCEERYTFNSKIKPELERDFTGELANKTTSYYFIVGQHQTVIQYAFKHNIKEWKAEYYKHFSRFVREVVNTHKSWINENDYYESHYILWASIFLQLSSHYDKENYSDYPFYTQETEEKLRAFLETYVAKGF